MFTLIFIIAIAFAAIVCYASCCAAARADRQTEEYFALKEAERRSENLKNE